MKKTKSSYLFSSSLLSKNVKINIHRTIILPVFFGMDVNIFSHAEEGSQAEGFREQGAEEVTEPKRDEVTGEQQRLHKEEVFVVLRPTKYYLGDPIKKTEMGSTFKTYGGEERSIQVFGGET